jgi:hypothetical protein
MRGPLCSERKACKGFIGVEIFSHIYLERLAAAVHGHYDIMGNET